jgi:hypothetical protein
MKELLITGIRNQNKEGVTLVFNQKCSMNSGIKSKEWWVSWDKIGGSLFPDDYCEESGVKDRDEIRVMGNAD